MNIVSPFARKNGAQLTLTDREGHERTWPTFSCAHCGRMVVVRAKDPQDFSSPWQLVSRMPFCRSCDKHTCKSPACNVGCHPFKADLERAYNEEMSQPWMLREGVMNDPVYRIYLPDGREQLIPQRESGFTDRELARMGRHG